MEWNKLDLWNDCYDNLMLACLITFIAIVYYIHLQIIALELDYLKKKTMDSGVIENVNQLYQFQGKWLAGSKTQPIISL